MSQEDLDFVKNLFTAFQELEFVSFMRDTPPEEMSALLETVYDPDVEIVWVDTSPDSGPYHGHDGVLQAFDGWLASFDEFHWTPTEFIDSGDEVVVGTSHRGRGKSSGAVVEMEVFWVLKIENGKIARWREFATRAGALKAAGLTE